MKFSPLEITGAWEIEATPHFDLRGSFARIFCTKEFAEHGLEMQCAQTNLSVNLQRGTFRGLHWQDDSAPEAKYVRCIRGSALDVIVDVRAHSETYLHSAVIPLSATKANAVYVPTGCAHGFLTLEDNTELLYQVSHPYTPSAERGARFDDPAFDLVLPFRPVLISQKDRDWPDFHP